MSNTTDRFGRQRDLVPQARLAGLCVTVVGAGAIGRQVALQLAALGARRLELVDFDAVDATNVTTQGYRAGDVGVLKVEALAADLRQLDAELDVAIVADRWRPRRPLGDVAFCCVDRISTRAAIWRGGGVRTAFWADGRLRGDTVRVLTAGDAATRARYEQSLFPQAEAQMGACTAGGTIYAAAVAAGLLIAQFVRWLRGQPTASDLTLNLLADELAPTAAAAPEILKST